MTDGGGPGPDGSSGQARAPARIHLDLKGLKCPLPALRVRKALATLAPGTELVVSCTDPLSVIDVPHAAHEMGDTFAGREEADGVLIFTLRKAG